jgi:hypothetical protein
MNLKKELQKVNDKIGMIAKMIEKMIDVAEAPEKPKAKLTKAKPVEKVAAVKTVGKKPVKLTAADTVLGIIKKSKKGIDTAAIIEKTGLKSGHIHNIVSILKKQGKVKSAKKGIYMIADPQ